MMPVATPLLERKSAAAHAKIVGIMGPNAKPDKHQSAIMKYLSTIKVAARIERALNEAQVTMSLL